MSYLKIIKYRLLNLKQIFHQFQTRILSFFFHLGSPNGTFTATPVMASGSDFRTRNLSSLSRSTTSSDYSETSYYEYWYELLKRRRFIFLIINCLQILCTQIKRCEQYTEKIKIIAKYVKSQLLTKKTYSIQTYNVTNKSVYMFS